MSDDSLLELRGVQITPSQRPDLVLFECVDWCVAPGDFWIVGSTQGSGKSAVMELASGRNRPPQGEVRHFGENIFQLPTPRPDEIRRRIGLVFDQGGRIFHHMTVAENITLPLRYHRQLSLEAALVELAPLIEAAELGRMLDSGAGRIPRGWAWRTACVRALALQPELLLFDNPMAGLDREHARWCRAFIGRLTTEGIGLAKPSATILACDDLRPWVGLGRQFALASAGKWEALGNRQCVLDSVEPVIRGLLERDY